ncbi:odorant receptor 67d [Culex quinquefasciatus]|uniref:odorant receptor 67d n=1 Tax=Culex quinquefasciatus TaxID=7176 RepID=UPI0018E34FED|nr:odorant receptor 67d [Culex quinquefasciatus]
MHRLPTVPKFTKSWEMFEYNLLFVRRLVDFVGLDFMIENYKFNWRTGSAVFFCVTVFGLSLYNTAFYYPDMYKICEVSIPLSICLQSVTKLYYGYRHRHFYLETYDRIRQLHLKHQNHEENNAKLLLLIERIHVLSKLMTLLYTCGGLSYLAYPVLMHFMYQERVLALALRIPFVDADSTTGYIITNLYHVILIIVGCAGISAADIVITLMVGSLVGFVDVFTSDMNDLDRMLDSGDRNEEIIRDEVKSICGQHQHIIEYESDLDERYIVICFVQVFTSISGVVVALFLVYMIQFIPGYMLVLASFVQLLQLCLLGTVLTVKNEQITETTYNLRWYLLRKSEQKCILQMLHKSQSFVEMTVGGFAPLNLETFVSIMNRIYTYFMMLIQFLEQEE